MNDSFKLSKRDKQAVEGVRRRLAKFHNSLKPDCPWCGVENTFEQYQGRHSPYSIYICKKCKQYFHISFSMMDGRIVKVMRGSF